MSITSLGGGGANSLLLQQMLASLSANAVDQTDGPDAAGSADSTGQPATALLGPAPPPADNQPSDLFSSDILGALTAAQATGSGQTAGSGAATTTATTASTSDPTAASDATSDQQAANMLATLMLQYANTSYSSQAQAAMATTPVATSITA